MSAWPFLVHRPETVIDPQPCASVFGHSCGPASIRYTCTLPAPHPGQLHEHRPRPDRMAVAQWA